MLRYSTAMIAAWCVAASATAQQSVQPNVSSPIQRDPSAVLPAKFAHLAPSVSVLNSAEVMWKQVQGANSVRIVGVPLGPNYQATVQLQRIDPFTEDATIVETVADDKGQPVERALNKPAGDYYIGTVEGQPDSHVVLTHTVLGVNGYVEDSTGFYVISNGPYNKGLPLVSYRQADLPEGTLNWFDWHCQEIPAGPVDLHAPEGGVADDPPCRQLKVAVDSDWEFTDLMFAGDTSASASYIGVVFTGVYEIYNHDFAVRPAITYLRVWGANVDPYGNAMNAGDQLLEFQAHWQANMGLVQRNTAHMVSVRGLGGGVAYLGALCNSQAYGVSGNMYGFFPYPLQDNNDANWDVMVVAHEIGHNLGAPHTHDYCPPADQCPPQPYWGQCQTQQVCISTGTIMSYCHVCDGGMNNIQLHFHPNNISSIANYMGGLGGSCNLQGTAQPPFGVNDYYTVPRGVATDLDVLGNEVAFNCEAVHISSYLTTTSKGGTVSLLPGAGPGGRDMLRYTSAPAYEGDDVLWYKLTDASSQQSGFLFAYLTVQSFRFPDNPVGDTAGLDVKYFELSNPSSMPDYVSLAPYATSTAAQVNYSSTNGNFADSERSNEVGARWTGFVNVDQVGVYTFSTTSDDGSILKIGNVAVVANDGLHAMQERGGAIGLLPGKHAITIDFFENQGGAGCIVQLTGPGIPKAPIAISRFTHGSTPNPYDLNNDGGVDGADLGIVLGAWGTNAPAPDFNDDGIVDGADLGALLAAWAP